MLKEYNPTNIIKLLYQAVYEGKIPMDILVRTVADVVQSDGISVEDALQASIEGEQMSIENIHTTNIIKKSAKIPLLP